MPAPIDVRHDYSPANLRDFASELSDRSHARRLKAIAAVLEGKSRTQAAQIGGMERQTLRDWVHRFNTEGPDGLKSLRSPGRPPKLNAAQQRELAAIVARGPEGAGGVARGPERAEGVARWRLADLVKLIREKFGVEHDEVSVGRLMRKFGYVYTGVEWRCRDSVDLRDSIGLARNGEDLATPFDREPHFIGALSF